MMSYTPSSPGLLSANERSAIAEIEATTNILKLVSRLTKMRFAVIAKFTDSELITCSVYDPGNLGIEAGVAVPLDNTVCSEFRTNPEALFLSEISKNPRFSARWVVKRYALESYAGLPIFLPDGSLYGALCVMDSQTVTFNDPDLAEELALFARLIGCIFFTSMTCEEHASYQKAPD